MNLAMLCFAIKVIKKKVRHFWPGLVRAKNFWENEDGSNVDPDRKELGNGHEVVPPLDGEHDHEELGQDEGAEAQQNNVDEVVLKQDQRPVQNHRPCSAEKMTT
jgi:hypothetical protein